MSFDCFGCVWFGLVTASVECFHLQHIFSLANHSSGLQVLLQVFFSFMTVLACAHAPISAPFKECYLTHALVLTAYQVSWKSIYNKKWKMYRLPFCFWKYTYKWTICWVSVLSVSCLQYDLHLRLQYQEYQVVMLLNQTCKRIVKHYCS